MISHKSHWIPQITFNESTVFITDLLPSVNSRKWQRTEARQWKKMIFMTPRFQALFPHSHSNFKRSLTQIGWATPWKTLKFTPTLLWASVSNYSSRRGRSTNYIPKKPWTNDGLKITFLSPSNTLRTSYCAVSSLTKCPRSEGRTHKCSFQQSAHTKWDADLATGGHLDSHHFTHFVENNILFMIMLIMAANVLYFLDLQQDQEFYTISFLKRSTCDMTYLMWCDS